MTGKIISDIRLYRSEIANIDGNSLPEGFNSMASNVKVHRMVMKLREMGFSLGDFDHLYINFTTCKREGEMLLSQRSIAPHQWYRYYDVGVSRTLYEAFTDFAYEEEMFSLVEKVLASYFATATFDEDKIHECFCIALAEGESMLMRFKEKVSAKNRAVIYLSLLDNGYYKPLLRVYDLEGQLLLEKDLPEMLVLNALGQIQLCAKKITIKPRENAYTRLLKNEPIIFSF